MKVICYIRVSTKDQKLEVQQEEIERYCKYRGHEILKIYQDKASGKNVERAGFSKMMNDLEANLLQVDALIIWKLDRIGRNLRDLLEIVDNLKRLKINFISIYDNIETDTTTGRLFFHICGAFAEHEREILLERTALGREWAMRHGRKFGRKPIKLNMVEIIKRKSVGVSTRRLAKDFKVSRATIKNKLNEYYKAQSEAQNLTSGEKLPDDDQRLEKKKNGSLSSTPQNKK